MLEINQLRQLEKFDSLRQECCMAYIPATFVGLGSSNSPAEKINDIMKQTLSMSDTFVNAISRLCRIFESINQKATTMNLFKYPIDQLSHVFSVRNHVNRKIFEKFLRQYLESVKYQVYEDGPDSYQARIDTEEIKVRVTN